ncbi:aspartate dehydrogenase [Methanothermococcus sp. SCGC AD-155-N22]|nr:aspartate dehydrogenase [Methanothermococcus sp. SCGC AD-155-N22]
MLRIGLVGCGAIATIIVNAVLKGIINPKVVALYDRHLHKAEKLGRLVGAQVCHSIEELVRKDLDIVIECASIRAVEDVATKAIENGKDVIVMSVGAFKDPNLYKRLYNLAKRHNRRIYIPSGAVAGIDGIKAASLGEIYEVTLTTVKPVEGLRDSLEKQGIDVDTISEPTTVFEGSFLEAIERFPQNINVSLVLYLASNYPTKVKIVADPGISVNRHEVIVRGSTGTIRTVVENIPCKENPKTSALAAYSVIRLIKDLSEPIVIGT